MGISHHDVAVIWWKEFWSTASAINLPISILHILQVFTQRCLCWQHQRSSLVLISSVLPPVMSAITDPFANKSPKETCLNYDTSSITCILQQLHFMVAGNECVVSIEDDNEGPCNTQQETTLTMSLTVWQLAFWIVYQQITKMWVLHTVLLCPMQMSLHPFLKANVQMLMLGDLITQDKGQSWRLSMHLHMVRHTAGRRDGEPKRLEFPSLGAKMRAFGVCVAKIPKNFLYFWRAVISWCVSFGYDTAMNSQRTIWNE